MDDRHDLYGSDFLKAYLGAIHVERGWEEFLHQTNPGCVLMPRDVALASILGKTARMEARSYEDQTAIAFVRAQ